MTITVAQLVAALGAGNVIYLPQGARVKGRPHTCGSTDLIKIVAAVNLILKERTA